MSSLCAQSFVTPLREYQEVCCYIVWSECVHFCEERPSSLPRRPRHRIPTCGQTAFLPHHGLAGLAAVWARNFGR